MTTLDRKKVLLGVIDVRMEYCEARVKEETLKTVSVNNQRFRIKVSQLSFPSYDEDLKGCMKSWGRFVSAIDAVNIPSVQQFTYLLGFLQGSVYAAIARITITSVKY